MLFGKGLMATFQMSSAASLNLGRSQNGVLGNNNFKFDENGRKFSVWVENTVGKGETALYEQFLLFQPCFQKTSNEDT